MQGSYSINRLEAEAKFQAEDRATSNTCKHKKTERSLWLPPERARGESVGNRNWRPKWV